MLRPKDKPLTLLNTIYDGKGIPLYIPSMTNGTPFTYLGYNYAFLNCFKYTVF